MNFEQILGTEMSVQTFLLTAATAAALWFGGRKAVSLAKNVAYGTVFAGSIFLAGLGLTGHSIGDMRNESPKPATFNDEVLADLAQHASPENFKLALEYRGNNKLVDQISGRFGKLSVREVALINEFSRLANDKCGPAIPAPVDYVDDEIAADEMDSTAPSGKARQWAELLLGAGLVIVGVVKYASHCE